MFYSNMLFFCFRLRFFNQLEDELQSHQHEEQWLRDKGNQLAQRDAELAGEVLREISLLETTWDDTKKLITERCLNSANGSSMSQATLHYQKQTQKTVRKKRMINSVI